MTVELNMDEVNGENGLKNHLDRFTAALDVDVCAKASSTARVGKIKEKVSQFLSELKSVCIVLVE